MMTVRQVAELLGVHENWVYDQAAAGLLPSYKIGGARRFLPDELRGWIADRRQPTPERRPRTRARRTRPARAISPSPSSSPNETQPRLFEQ